MIPDFPGLAAHLCERSRALLPAWFPHGRWSGHEFHVGNLAGDPGQSLSVNANTGKWSDFAADQKGGDLISLFAAANGLTQLDAYRRLLDEERYDPLIGVLPPPKPKRKIGPPPEGAPLPSFVHRLFGAASEWWCYRSAEGHPLFYVSRHDPPWPDGVRWKSKPPTHKQILPWSWSINDADWRHWAYPRPRPLYGLELLGKAPPNAWVLLVEGEKAAEAARRLVPSIYVAMTWPGGGQAMRWVDWTPLTGRRVLLWPDADVHASTDAAAPGVLLAPELQPGALTMARIGAALLPLCPEVRIIDVGVEESREAGWDAADALEDGWTWARLKAWAEPRVRQFEPSPEPSPPDEDEPPPPEPGGVEALGGPPLFSEEQVARSCSSRWEDSLLYCAEWGRWLRWRDGCWRPDICQETREAVRGVCVGASRVWADRLAAMNKSVDQARKVASRRFSRAVEGLMESDYRHRAMAAQFDRDPYLLGTPAGVVDLRTGEQLPASRGHMITKATVVVPGGSCPYWLSFLAAATGGDPDLEAYLQRVAGYCLTGTSREHVAFFLYGPTASGKSTFIEALGHAMGDYARAADVSLLTPTGNEHPTEIARLQGVRLVVMSETEEGKAIAESRFKSLVAGDTMSARFMRADYFDFVPICKLVLHGNHRPRLRSTDESVRRRLNVVPFEEVVPMERRDRGLPEKLQDEAGGILSWAIEGCLDYLKNGLKPPDPVSGAGESYFEAEDVVQRFLDDCADVAPHYKASRAGIWRAWEVWAKGQGEHARSNRWLTENLRRKGFVEVKSYGARMFCGLHVSEADANNENPRVY